MKETWKRKRIHIEFISRRDSKKKLATDERKNIKMYSANEIKFDYSDNI